MTWTRYLLHSSWLIQHKIHSCSIMPNYMKIKTILKENKLETFFLNLETIIIIIYNVKWANWFTNSLTKWAKTFKNVHASGSKVALVAVGSLWHRETKHSHERRGRFHRRAQPRGQNCPQTSCSPPQQMFPDSGDGRTSYWCRSSTPTLCSHRFWRGNVFLSLGCFGIVTGSFFPADLQQEEEPACDRKWYIQMPRWLL